MKKKILFLSLFCVGLIFTAFAQKSTSVLKPMVGMQYTSVKAPQMSTMTIKPSVAVGLVADFNVSKKLSVEAGFQYSDAKVAVGRSIKWRPDITPSPWHVKETNTFRYMNFPVMAVYKISKPAQFYVGGGCGMSLNLTTEQSGYETTMQLNEKGYLNRFSMQSSLGLPVGFYGQLMLGKDWKVGKLNGGLRVQYTLDATSWKYPASGTYERDEPYKLRNSGVSLNAYINLTPPSTQRAVEKK